MAKEKSAKVLQLSDEKCAELIEAIALEELDQGQSRYSLKSSDVGQEILKLDRLQQADLVMAMVRCSCRPQSPPKSIHAGGERSVHEAMTQLLNRTLPFTHDRVVELLQKVAPHYVSPESNTEQVTEFNENLIEQIHEITEGLVRDRLTYALLWPSNIAQITKVAEHFAKDNPMTPKLEQLIGKICTKIDERQHLEHRKYSARLKQLIQEVTGAIAIEAGEAWSDRAIESIESLATATRSLWVRLLQECSLSSGSKPSAKWVKGTQPCREAIGLKAFKQALLDWFPLVDRPRTQAIESWSQWVPDPNNLIGDRNADILKGLVWLCADLADPDLARALSKLAISAYKKAPGVGPRCVRLGNACVWALGEMDLSEAVSQLAFLKVKIKFGTAQKGLDKALTAAAERLNVPRAEIEEMAVPAYGLEEVGCRREQLGDFTAELVVTGTSSVELRWLKPDGKPQKSVPKVVKDNHAEELKELKQAAKDIQKMLPAQRDRIENLYLEQKTWDYSIWRERYLDHPLIGTLARRIIWEFQAGDRVAAAIWRDDNLVGRDGQPLDWLTEGTQVRLWHPIGSSSEAILAWREFLSDREIKQPFKQAHREIYLLTEAEENTRVYSNRFAAHIIKQHQFNALCAQRGWKNQLRLMVDDSYEPAMRLLPQWGLRAEFWVEGIGEDYGTDTTESGSYLYLTADRVSFYPIDAAANYSHAYGGGYAIYGDGSESGQPIPLDRIPAFVFTEIMRDVDLFVGVASVGNDPNWNDGGPEGRHRNYWYDYSFGELSETAKTRRQVLEKLLPRLKKIRDRCEIQDRFLVVRGDIRTYKIHLRSGNILMEPDDRYLCIVPTGSKTTKNTDGVFLPFEGDRILAIILSKAFLLAEDTKIKDPTILSQLGK